MKIALVCSILGVLCGHSVIVHKGSEDRTFACPEGAAQYGGSMVAGSQYYRPEDAEPGRCRWALDEEAMKRADERERHRQELWWALRSRPLTDKEMSEVKRMGIVLTVGYGVSYREEEKMRELNDALFQQYRLQAEAAHSRDAPDQR
jgi:hypothetical protein